MTGPTLEKAICASAFGQTLRTFRCDAHLSQEHLAELADIDPTYPSLLERGLREPTLSMVIRLGRALNIDPAVLVDRTLHRIDGRNGS